MSNNKRRTIEHFIKEEKANGNDRLAEGLKKLAKAHKELSKKREAEGGK